MKVIKLTTRARIIFGLWLLFCSIVLFKMIMLSLQSFGIPSLLVIVPSGVMLVMTGLFFFSCLINYPALVLQESSVQVPYLIPGISKDYQRGELSLMYAKKGFFGRVKLISDKGRPVVLFGLSDEDIGLIEEYHQRGI